MQSQAALAGSGHHWIADPDAAHERRSNAAAVAALPLGIEEVADMALPELLAEV